MMVSLGFSSERDHRDIGTGRYSATMEIEDTSVENHVLSSPRGFTTSIGRTQSRSSFTGYSHTNYDFWIGFGYNLSPDILAEMRIYTGSETGSVEHVQPVVGKFDFGGGALLLTYRFLHGGTWRPFLTGGYELGTILTSAPQSGPGSGTSGYNGRGLQLYAGLEYYVNEHLSLEGNTAYRHLDYVDPIINANNLGRHAIQTDQSIGISIGCNIHFNFVP
ncbi:MAG TPA: hypothetical protein VLY03_13565 [Bacteroidota bacterium]|nr:hypothetical protein [Bacteroidota bacterium]